MKISEPGGKPEPSPWTTEKEVCIRRVRGLASLWPHCPCARQAQSHNERASPHTLCPLAYGLSSEERELGVDNQVPQHCRMLSRTTAQDSPCGVHWKTLQSSTTGDQIQRRKAWLMEQCSDHGSLQQSQSRDPSQCSANLQSWAGDPITLAQTTVLPDLESQPRSYTSCGDHSLTPPMPGDKFTNSTVAHGF